MKHKLVIATFSSGSTYFQRASTFWISQLLNDKISNPHELLNGIAFRDDYLVKQWMKVTDQSLDTIVGLIQQSNRPILARISYDHLLLRNERPEKLEEFYTFLNENFEIFTCYRDNLFDYGMCWAVRRCTNRHYDYQINNVHSPEDRIKLYAVDNKFTIDPQIVITQAEKYLRYKEWATTTFPYSKSIHYEDISDNIDKVLEQCFPAQQTIKEKFGISISEYTKYKYDKSNSILTADDPLGVKKIDSVLKEMLDSQILLDSIPIKSTTMQDKMDRVTNFNDSLDIFNTWKNRAV